jgi:hypothetical protein
MPDISTINNVAVADISKLDAVTFAHGQKVNNQDVSLVTDAHTLIATRTVPADESAPVSSIDIESGIDGTYDVYEFILSSLHPSADAAKLRWRSSTDGGSSYGVATTTSFYQTYNHETSGSTNFSYAAGLDAADSTSDDIYLTDGVGFDNDQTASGRILLFNPSNTTFTKHFIAEIQQSSAGNTCNCSRSSGTISTTSAVDAIQFSFSSGDINSGVIKMFGYGLP